MKERLDDLLGRFAELRRENLEIVRGWNLTEAQLALPRRHPELGGTGRAIDSDVVTGTPLFDEGRVLVAMDQGDDVVVLDHLKEPEAIVDGVAAIER